MPRARCAIPYSSRVTKTFSYTVVIHLAARLGSNDIHEIVGANVIGAYNVMEAARRCGLRRVVFASAGAVSMNRETEEPYLTLVTPNVPLPDVPKSSYMITHLDEPRPHGLYGAFFCTSGPGVTICRSPSVTMRSQV